MNFKARMITHEVISGLGYGLFQAVQGIFLLEKGMDFWMISIIVGTFGMAAFTLELPFGAVADIHGHIMVFRISVVTGIASFIETFRLLWPQAWPQAHIGGVISAFVFAFVINLVGISTKWTIIAGIAVGLGVLRILMGLASAKRS